MDDVVTDNRIEKLETRVVELEKQVEKIKTQQERAVTKDKEKYTLLDKAKKKINELLGGEKNA